MYNLYMRWVIIIRVHKNWQCLILQTLFIISLHNILYTRSHTPFNCTHHSHTHTLSTHMVSTTIWKIKFTSAKSYIMTGDPLSKNLTSRLCNWGLPILRIPIDFTFSHTKSAKNQRDVIIAQLPGFLYTNTPRCTQSSLSCTCSFLPYFHSIQTFFTFVSLMLARRGRPPVRVLVDALEMTIFIIFPARAILLIYQSYIDRLYLNTFFEPFFMEKE